MIKVKLLAGTHSVYKELINFPPPNIKYSCQKEGGDIKHYKWIAILKRKILSSILVPRIIYLPLNKNSLIHSCRGVLILNKKPWIVDFEHITSCVGNDFNKINNFYYKKIIERFFSSPYCKKILPWSYAAKQTIVHYLNAIKFKDKIEVVYPAMHTVNFKKKKSNKIRILFVAHAFLAKGGLDLIEAFKILSKRYDLELTLITNLPKEYKNLERLSNINFLPPLPREKVFGHYKQADIFCLPSFVDSFGFALLEAKAFGLPIIASDFFAMPEIIKENQTGLTVKLPPRIKQFPYTKNPTIDISNFNNYVNKAKHKELITQLVKKIKTLIERDSLRKKFAKEGKKEIEKGKFSIKERNKKLKRIYEEILE